MCSHLFRLLFRKLPLCLTSFPFTFLTFLTFHLHLRLQLHLQLHLHLPELPQLLHSYFREFLHSYFLLITIIPSKLTINYTKTQQYPKIFYPLYLHISYFSSFFYFPPRAIVLTLPPTSRSARVPCCCRIAPHPRPRFASPPSSSSRAAYITLIPG